ncbi:MAG: CAP domain-containing protein [Chloroflexota bacterium]|nr:CAP domain-containing protein [Chloroflexota bacterium]MDQ2940169.1 CAP domain-containing protein [Actinomycetota bacterium]
MSSNHHTLPVPRRLATLILVALAGTSLLLTVAALRPAPGFARGGGCSGAGGIPAGHSLGELRSATLCLINKIRHHHGLGSLHSQKSLRKAAQGHSSDMVQRDYFSHDSPGGGSIQTRIGGSGYFAGARSYQYGEVIGGGTKNSGAPKAVSIAWMQSPPHRAAILDGGFHDLGVGVAHGFPGTGNHGATFTIDFGSRN